MTLQMQTLIVDFLFSQCFSFYSTCNKKVICCFDYASFEGGEIIRLTLYLKLDSKYRCPKVLL